MDILFPWCNQKLNRRTIVLGERPHSCLLWIFIPCDPFQMLYTKVKMGFKTPCPKSLIINIKLDCMFLFFNYNSCSVYFYGIFVLNYPGYWWMRGNDGREWACCWRFCRLHCPHLAIKKIQNYSKILKYCHPLVIHGLFTLQWI